MPKKVQLEYSRATIVLNIVMTTMMELFLRFFGFKKSWRLLSLFVPEVEHNEADRTVVRRQLLAMKRAKKRKLVFGKCLARSLVLWWQLRRRGLSSNLVIGVRHKIDFRAHAWVEFDDEPLNAGDKVHSRYNNIATFNHPNAIK